MRRLFGAACAALVAGGMLAGTARAQEIAIGAIYLDAQGFYAGVRKGVQDGAKEMGREVSVIETNAQADVSKESSFIDRLISSGVNAIILSAVSTDGSVEAISRANEAGIPVICYNTCVNDKAMEQYVYAYAIGGVAAEYFTANGITEPQIGILNCEFVEVCVQRRLGFEKAMEEKVPGYKVVSNQEGTILDNAISVAEAMITANPEMNVIFGESGGATLGAALAVRNRDAVGKVVVFGSDMTTELAQELIKGDVIKGQVDVSGTALGKLALAQAIKAVDGEPRGEILVQNPIDLYTTAEQAQTWLETHPDGLP